MSLVRDDDFMQKYSAQMIMKHRPHLKKKKKKKGFIQACCVQGESSSSVAAISASLLPIFVHTVLYLRGHIHPIQVALGGEVVCAGETDRKTRRE